MVDSIDAETYPHIFRAIVAAAPPAGLLALRTASKSLRDTVDARLATHILIWADGRVSSRLQPTARLPRPLSNLGDHVKVLDLQAPHVNWALYPYPESDDDTPSLKNLEISESSNGATTPPCRCGWSSTRPAPHLSSLPPMPNLTTVRRWGPHTCWAPPSPHRVTHYGPALDAESGAVPDEVAWYIHSPAAMSRFNRLDLGDIPGYVIAGARTGALFDMIDELKVKREVDSADEAECGSDCDSQCSQCGGDCYGRGQGRRKGKGRRMASRADHFAALLAMFWLDDEDEDGLWALVDVEAWPQWEGLSGVAETIRERVTHCCVAADWDEAQMKGIERKLRFISSTEYEEEVGEVAALEGDDHGWVF